MRLRFFSPIVFLFTVCQGVLAQSSDSLWVLGPDTYLAIVRKYHPVVLQADITVQKAEAGVLAARGAFDPRLGFTSDQKRFGGTQYYLMNQPELKIPTWYGIEVKAGLETNRGDYLNSELTPGASSYLGISVPLARNLLMDRRRATLAQSKIFRQQSYAERLLMVNDLLQDAGIAYWEWVKNYALFRIADDAARINQQRLDWVRRAVEIGERPAIDTTEALSQLNQFRYLSQEALVRWQVSTIDLSAYLWTEGARYVNLPESVRPDSAWTRIAIPRDSMPLLTDLLQQANLNHPKLLILRNKIYSLGIERKLRYQDLLPTLNLNTTLLNKGYRVWKGANSLDFLNNNNKFGIEFGVPLRLSRERAEYRLVRLRTDETRLQLTDQERLVSNKISYFYRESAGLQKQVESYDNLYNNYLTLLRAEETRFRAGESSLFLLNARENKVLEGANKLTELRIKYLQARVKLDGAAATLPGR